MNRTKFAIIAALLCATALIAESPNRSTASLPEDAAFEKALNGGDKLSLANLLAPEFTWTDAQGRTEDRSQFLEHPPANPMQASDAPAEHTYGDVTLSTSMSKRTHEVRIWVHEHSGWKLLAMQETTLAEQATPPKNDSRDCENPCKTLPYSPKNQAERDIITSWQQLETAVTHHDAQTWAQHVADEFTLVNNNNDHVYSKADRMAVLDRQKQSDAPSAPVPLRSAQMFDFGDAVVMKADHRRDTGKAIHVTRLWIKRDGHWIMAFSQQTTVQ